MIVHTRMLVRAGTTSTGALPRKSSVWNMISGGAGFQRPSLHPNKLVSASGKDISQQPLSRIEYEEEDDDLDDLPSSDPRR